MLYTKSQDSTKIWELNIKKASLEINSPDLWLLKINRLKNQNIGKGQLKLY